MYCDCFILPFLLPTPTIWFSPDHKRNVSDGNVLILLTPIPSRLWFWELGKAPDWSCFKENLLQSKALPRSGQWHNWHQYEISAPFAPHWHHFVGKPVVTSWNVMTVFSGYINWNHCWVVLSVVGLVNQPCLSVLLFLKFILQSKPAAKWVPCDCCTALPSIVYTQPQSKIL